MNERTMADRAWEVAQWAVEKGFWEQSTAFAFVRAAHSGSMDDNTMVAYETWKEKVA